MHCIDGAVVEHEFRGSTLATLAEDGKRLPQPSKYRLAPRQVVGFDMVDDESKPERRPNKHMHAANEWDLKHNPAYAYYAYYTYANLYVLNKFREARGLSTFAFRPHAGATDSESRTC